MLHGCILFPTGSEFLLEYALHMRHAHLGAAVGQADMQGVARMELGRVAHDLAFAVAHDGVAALERALRVQQFELRGQALQGVAPALDAAAQAGVQKIGRASCRERVF